MLPNDDEIPDAGRAAEAGITRWTIPHTEIMLVTVPNADFAKMQLENLLERARVLMRETLCLQYGTPRGKLRHVVTEIESMLREHPRIGDERLRVRFMGFGGHFLEVELFAYALTDNQPEFFEIREDLLLKVMEIVEEAGARLALPTEIHYVQANDPIGGQQPTA